MSKPVLLFGILLVFKPVLAQWSCSSDQDCSSMSGSVCNSGSCVCPTGTQVALGGTLCADVAPYHTSPCVEDHQCQRLFTGFQCRRGEGIIEGTCQCLPGHHFFKGRCWQSRGYGETCSRDEECFGVIRDPNSLACAGVCGCAEGFFERQRGECRRAGLAVGAGCVLNEDCRFDNGSCNTNTFTCFSTNEPEPEPNREIVTEIKEHKMAAMQIKMADGQHGASCGVSNPCNSPLVCASFGMCVCPIGFYANENGTLCLAELESPATEEQCVGLFVTLIDGVCTCPANFFFQESMRDCIKVARFITDACVSDETCHTFGAAARCGAPRPPWGMRSCECIPDLAIWDSQRNICRIFAALGETCEVDSDCLAGDLEIQCVKDSHGNGVCTCPEELAEFEGLCITTGLELGEACQISQECTGTDNLVCADGRCACDEGYQQVKDFCAPVIGGRCQDDENCVIEHTVCRNTSGLLTCQCGEGFVADNDICWPEVYGYGFPCNVTAQCTSTLGADSHCVDGRCICQTGHHYRDGQCWLKTGLFESCTRRSQCFLGDITERVVCRNSRCQCDFQFPFNEQLNTCTSSAPSIAVSGALFTTFLILLLQ